MSVRGVDGGQGVSNDPAARSVRVALDVLHFLSRRDADAGPNTAELCGAVKQTLVLLARVELSKPV